MMKCFKKFIDEPKNISDKEYEWNQNLRPVRYIGRGERQYVGMSKKKGILVVNKITN